MATRVIEQDIHGVLVAIDRTAVKDYNTHGDDFLVTMSLAAARDLQSALTEALSPVD